MNRSQRKVLMLAYSFPPSNNVGVFRSLRFAKYLPKFGWRPIIVSVDPAAGHLPFDQSLLEQVPRAAVLVHTRMWWPDEVLAPYVNILRRVLAFGRLPHAGPDPQADGGRPGTQTTPSNGDGRTPGKRLYAFARNTWQLMTRTPDKRMWWAGPALAASMKAIRCYSPSVIVSTCPPYTTHLIALALKWMTGLPVILDFRDPWARDPWAPDPRTPGLINPWGKKLAARLEGLCVRQADGIILNTDRMRRDFVERYQDVSEKKMVSIYNGYDSAVLRQVQLYNRKVREPSSNGPQIRIVHAGSLHERRDPMALMEALRILLDDGVPVLFEQYGGFQDRLAPHIERLRLQHSVMLRGLVSHAELLQKMAGANVFVLIQPNTAVQVPSKLYEYLMYRKPILAITGEGETADIVHRFRLGAVADPNNPVDIASKLRRIITGWGSVPSADGIEEALRRFDGRTLTQKLANLLDALSQRSRGG